MLDLAPARIGARPRGYDRWSVAAPGPSSLGAQAERATVHVRHRSRQILDMLRPFVVFVLMLGLNTAALGTATGRVIDAGRLGTLPVVLPEGEVQEVVFLFSDLTGWHADLDRAADRLSAIGAAVLEVDLPGYLARLGEGDDQDCHYLISEVEGTSKRLQRELGLTHYLSPILAGTGMGAALAYAALAQAPAATVAGAISDGLVTELATRLPLCPGAPSTPAASGFDYGPKPTCPAGGGSAFRRRRRPQPSGSWPASPRPSWSRSRTVPGSTHAWCGCSRSRSEQRPRAGHRRELPLVELPASGPGDLMAVFYSGDGGWRDLDKQIGGILAAQGMPRSASTASATSGGRRAPQQVADDLATILRHYRAAWGREHAILLGYSFGAGILPFAVNRLPPAERATIRQISLLGLEKFAPFEFHVTDWLGVGNGGSAPSPARDRSWIPL